MSRTSKTLGLVLAWAGWALALLASPVAMWVLAVEFDRPPDSSNLGKGQPWPALVINELVLCHLAISAVAAGSAFWLSDDWGVRALACGLVVVLLGLTLWLSLWASMAVTGTYL